MSTYGLSTAARLKRQGAFEHFNTGERGPRASARMPALPGFTRGTLGSTGVRSPGRPLSRNPDAKEDEERAIIRALMGGG